MRLKDFCEGIGIPAQATWADCVAHVRKVMGAADAPVPRDDKWTVRETGSGSLWIDCHGVYVAYVGWKDGRWEVLGAPCDAMEQLGFQGLGHLQQELRPFLDTLAPRHAA